MNTVRSSTVRVPGILIRETAALIVRNGQSSITVNEILEYSGVSRGAMFHHFGCKQDLVDATFSFWLQSFNLEVERRMLASGPRLGSFTDAYVASVSEGCKRHDVAMLSALLIRLDPTQVSASRWMSWMTRKLAVEPGEADDFQLFSRRLAADGLWLSCLCAPGPSSDPQAGEVDFEYSR